MNNTLGKYERVLKGEKPSAFIDREGWKRFIRGKRTSFEKLASEKAAQLQQRGS